MYLLVSELCVALEYGFSANSRIGNAFFPHLMKVETLLVTLSENLAAKKKQ